MHRDYIRRAMKVLVVEDEQSIADSILYSLRLEGFETEHTVLGNQAISLLLNSEFDIVILDVGLPDINGFEVCKKIRQFSELPIIFLTARDHEIDRVVGFEIGGDDYVTKPFSPRELVARVKAILKRVTTKKVVIKRAENTNLFAHDPEKKRFIYCGESLDLTRYEYGLMSILFAKPECVFSREHLLQAVWSDSCDSFDRAVDTHIKTLRAKLKRINNQYEPIKTHRGFGYSMVVHHG